jgi:hypothetical protein
MKGSIMDKKWENDKIFKMELHEIMDLDYCEVLRVPSGWIYTIKSLRFGEGVGQQWMMTSTFVPMHRSEM